MGNLEKFNVFCLKSKLIPKIIKLPEFEFHFESFWWVFSNFSFSYFFAEKLLVLSKQMFHIKCYVSIYFKMQVRPILNERVLRKCFQLENVTMDLLVTNIHLYYQIISVLLAIFYICKFHIYLTFPIDVVRSRHKVKF